MTQSDHNKWRLSTVLPNDKETDTDKNVPNCCNQSCRKICQIDFL
jgi:hypothetical protein